MNGGKNEFLTNSKEKIYLSRSYRVIIFIILFLCQFLLNSLAGILSSASSTIKETYNYNDKQFSLFGSCLGFGKIIGSFAYMALADVIPTKYLIFFAFFFVGLFLCGFILTTMGWILIILRGFTGIFHVIITLYISIWIDQFGMQKAKMIMFGLIQLSNPSGKVCGYFMNLLFGEENWLKNIFLEGIIFLSVAIFVFLTPQQYFSSKVIKKKKQEERTTVFENSEDNTLSSKKNVKGFAFLSKFKEIFKILVFVFGMNSRSLIIGLNTAFHYWINEYMRNVLEVKDPKLILFSYSLISFLGPIGGIVLNSIITYFLISYEHKDAGFWLFIIHFIATTFGLTIPFMKNLNIFCIITIIESIFNSSAISMVEGIVINSLPTDLKGPGYAFVNLYTSLCTVMTLPFVYGAINDKYKETNKNMAMIALQIIGAIGCLFSLLTQIERRKLFQNIKGDGENTKNVEKKGVELVEK